MWAILDVKVEIGTGCRECDRAGAEKALAKYLAEKHEAPGALAPGELWVAEVMASYLKEHAVGSPSKEWIGYTAEPILIWWADKTLADVSGKNCRDYVMWRTAQRHRHGKHPKPISEQTARHELKTLRTAINWYHGEHGPLPSVPKVTLPQKKLQRPDYYLSRKEAAARIRAARSSPRLHHVARLILIGIPPWRHSQAAVATISYGGLVRSGERNPAPPRRRGPSVPQAPAAGAHPCQTVAAPASLETDGHGTGDPPRRPLPGRAGGQARELQANGGGLGGLHQA